MFKQLQYNDDFSKIVNSENIPKYISRTEDIPIETIKNIVEEAQKVVILPYKPGIFFCPGCCKKLDNNNYCKSCFRDYSNTCKKNNSKYFLYRDFNNLKNFGEFKYNYYKFEVINNEVLLYRIVYSSTYNIFNKEEYTIDLESVYWIRDNSVIELISNKTFLYKDILNIISNEYFDSNEEIVSSFSFCDINFLEVDSLDLLKNNVLYKYSYIWLLKEYFKNNNFLIHSLIVYPIYVKQFEYLVKMKLYNLACINPRSIEYKGNFVDTFKIQKKYYSFMKKIDITPNMLEILRIIKTPDAKILKEYEYDSKIIISISQKININKALDYVKKNNIDIFEYGEYLNTLKKLKINLHNQKCIYPKDFTKELHKVEFELNMLNNPDIKNRLKAQSSVFEINKYVDDKYIIFPAPSIESIYDEGYNQHNCLRRYIDMYANNECQIYFMRYKDNPNKSFVTIEVKNNEIEQAKCKYNDEPNDEIWKVLRKWEQSLIPVSVESQNMI